MVGNISVDEMISRVLMGESSIDIARDAEIERTSVSRVFRSETGVAMQKCKGLGRLILERAKNFDKDTILLDLVERVKNGDTPRKILVDVLGRSISK
ncbi:MAG TPA: hypothetical protein VFG19_02275 [Geobacteraceae bacterium]|nr:hypothetical protein [Geobacteraceae bacterium]